MLDLQKVKGWKEQEWLQSPAAIAYLEEEKSFVIERDIGRKQAERLKACSDNASLEIGSGLIKLFTSHIYEVDKEEDKIKEEEHSIHNNFRKQLIAVSNFSTNDPIRNDLFCAITGV